ncbi:kinase-like domain-containing protein [Glomus cerebriforme]|uniref:Kinase-like domain-containing protein n=1 Tax=Glomus cerebriforme TaxID=658196 RepID=A0A397T2H0_9GLOM|nr:kinase-like domain-containing protein [Glomus cerebriforme]
MEQKYLSDEVYEQLKERCKRHGLCKECKQPNSGHHWCQSCSSKRFQKNFKNWTSGNPNVDKLIQESQFNAKNADEKIEWIEYDKFEKINYIMKGGFGTIYKAVWTEGSIVDWNYESNQWERFHNRNVALKSLNDSKDITLEFLNEIKSNLKVNNSSQVTKILGITKDPETCNFMMVMEFAELGNLRRKINIDFNSWDWFKKIDIISDIAHGLSDIHKEGLTHQDFHSGNILCNCNFEISDLGLCKPANEESEKNNKNVYGVLPYVAPEVLRGKKYTQESDVYSFGIIIYEVCNGLPPYHDIAHDEFLAIKICQGGLRPSFINKVPKLIEDLVKQCVDADPSKRPTAEFLYRAFYQLYWDAFDSKNNKKDTEINKQIKEADEFNKKQSSFTISSDNAELTYTTHPQAIYTSRLLNFNNLPEQDNEYSGN